MLFAMTFAAAASVCGLCCLLLTHAGAPHGSVQYAHTQLWPLCRQSRPETSKDRTRQPLYGVQCCGVM